MGACCVSESNSSEETKGNNNKPQLQTADTRGTVQMHSHMDLRDIDERIKVLQRGNINELEEMIYNFDEDVNAYVFGQNKTLLLEAVIKCPNCQVVRIIMNKGADVNVPENQTGNTAIFLSALDLKVDFVKELLKYGPDLGHVNKYGQNIFEFLQFQLFDQRKSLGREMEIQERNKYDEIIQLLKEYLNEE